MVHKLRAYFIHYVITIKWTMFVQEIVFSSMSIRPRLNFNQNIGTALFGYKDVVTIKYC